MANYLDRDISWLSFNQKVSDETTKKIPLAEKIMFHGIAFSNLDEFMQVRYPAQAQTSSSEDLDRFLRALADHYKLIGDRFTEFNKKYRLIRKVKNLKAKQKSWVEKHFRQNIFPALQPITLDKSRQVNPKAGTYLLVVTENKDDDEFINYIEIPRKLDQFIPVPGYGFCISLVDLVMYHMRYIFRDRRIKGVYPFTILRSAEVYDQIDKQVGPLEMIRKTIREREKAWITRIEVISPKNLKVVKILKSILPIDDNTVFFRSDWVNLAALKSFPAEIFKGSDQARKLKPYVTFPSTSLFDYIKKEDRLAFHPYESYTASMVRFLKEAAEDKKVISIKITLYRVSDNSEIIDALLRAADLGKEVTVLVELKARFDEHHNIEISTALREGGVRIVYTKPDIKTHAKVCIVTRREKKGLRIYSHVGTGNYSESNAKQYTDYSFFTADQEIGYDLSRFFNLLTSDQGTFKSRKIIYAPYDMRDEISENIDREIKKAKNGKAAKIICKCNALTDDKLADKIIAAAKVGVKVTLIVRGACILTPRKNLKIYSIVGRFLEHSRVYLFGAGKGSRLYIGSSDLMHRNLSLRNELLILIENPGIKSRIMGHLKTYLRDNTNRREILANYKYRDIKPGKKGKSFSSQEMFIREAKKLALS